jgi:pimeloyl-ACP methyl ester carboxylesterase
MTNSSSEQSPSRPLGRRIVLALLVILLILATAGFLYENISEARDRRFNAMGGKLVDLGGRKMHINCSGESSPTVILDSGLGDSSLSWHKVQPEIAKFIRVCSYDRAGLGYSDPSSRPRTSRVIAEELHDLLQAAGVAPPYVIVGHSMGGFDVRLYTSMYPQEVVGMILVDASHPDQENRFPAELKSMEGSWQREAQFIAQTMPFGVPRVLGLCDEGAIDRAADCNGHTARERMAEIRAFPESATQAAATGPFGDLPLAVLSHDPDKASNDLPHELSKSVNKLWEAMQEDLARLSTRSTQMVAKNSGHYIQMDRPDVVIDAVRNVVDQARQAHSKQ